MKKQFLLGLMLSTFSASVFSKDDSQCNKVLQAFCSLGYKLYNATTEKESYKATKALNKLSHLYTSKNTASTHNKLLTELNVLEPNGCLSEDNFSKMVPQYAINWNVEEFQEYVIYGIFREADTHEKLIFFLFNLICFVDNKQRRHELCKAFFELMQAIKLDNKQIKNAILIKFGLVDDQGIILEETVNSVYRLPIYLDLINPNTEDIVHYFYFMNARNPIENPERHYLKFKRERFER